MLAAKRRTVAANWGVSETYQQQLTQAIQEYYSLLEAQLERDNALQSIRELQNQVRINEAKWKAGTGTKLDWMRSQTQQAQQERVLVNAENRVAQVEQALLNRLDLDVNVSLEAKLPNTPLADLRHVLVPESSEIASLVRVAITNHPSLKRFNEEIRALGIDYKAIRSDFLPSVTLTTFMNGTGPRFADLALSRFGGLAINVNLLENLGLRIPFRLQEKRAEIAQRILDQKTQLRAVEASVVQAFLNIRAFDKNIQVSAQEEALAQEAYRLALGRYQAGVGINIDVIDSQTDLANARNNLARAVLNYNRAQVQLLEALGLVSPDHLIHGVTANDLTP
jgi:outer membrane protein TolC